MIATSDSRLPSERERSGPGPVGLRFRSIMIATDCSPASATAVRLGARLAREFHAKLYVLHATMPELYGVGVPGPVPELAFMDLRTAQENLHQYALRSPELGSVVHKEVVHFGSAVEGIESAGKSHQIDLLVMGSHGRKGLGKLVMGSVAEWAISHVPYPVLVTGPACPKRFRPFQSIVLGTNLTDPSLRAAEYAAALAAEHQASLTLVHVLPAGSTAEKDASHKVDATRKLQALLPSGCADSCTVKFDLRTGTIGPAILQSAQENRASLIVLGTSHRTPLADHLPKTKLSAVIRGAHCPVLVVPAHPS